MNTNRCSGTDFTLTATSQLCSLDAITLTSLHRCTSDVPSYLDLSPFPWRRDWPGPADHAQEEAAQTGMSQGVALPKEALPDPAPYTWHITASPPHRKLGLKTQAGSC